MGTETQIISKEVYDKQSQDKFAAVVAEKDENGKPYLPTYYSSRIYIDLSESERYADEFERLLRWIFDKPLHVKPDVGKKPAFLEEGEHVTLGTTASFNRAIDALKNHKSTAEGAVTDYIGMFAENLERFRIENPEGEFDDAVVKNIEEFLPYRNEAIQIFTAIAKYAPEQVYGEHVHRFFENILPYMDRPEHMTQWQESQFDNFKFIVHELFLYALGIFIRHERFELAQLLLEQRYYQPPHLVRDGRPMVSFAGFRQVMRSLVHRNDRLGLQRLSVRADLLFERNEASGIDFRHIMQAGFVAFMRAELEAGEDFGGWWPETLLYIHRHHGPFEIFARASSKQYFERVKGLLGIESPADLESLLTSYQKGERRLPRWEFDSFSPAALLGYSDLATRP